MKNTVNIDIAGRNYAINTDEDAEYLQKLANLVTVKVLEVKRDTGASELDCTSIAALHFADCFLKEQQKRKPVPRKKASEKDEPQILG